MKAKLAPVFCLLFLFVSCGVPDNTVLQLQETNALLEAKNDSLVHVIEQLEQAPDEVVLRAKRLMAAGEKDSAVQMLRRRSQRSLTVRNAAEIARLLTETKGKVKRSRKPSLASLKSEVTDEDASLYKIDDTEKKLDDGDKVEHNWSVETTTPVVKRPAQVKTYGVRIGALCRDGTRSSATGIGACSNHGGVR